MIRRNGKLAMGGAIALTLVLGACSGDSAEILGPGDSNLERAVAEPAREPVREDPDIPERECPPAPLVQGLAELPEPC